MNAADASSWSAFAKGFDGGGGVTKNDFRVDLHGRSVAGSARVARGSTAGQFVFAWRDNRSGHFDVYTRAMPALE